MVFHRSVKFSNRLLFDKSAFTEITSILKEVGFHDLEVKIPKNSLFTSESYTPTEFVELNYNFPAVILIARRENEEIKFLFLNHSNKTAKFNDSTFPSSQSQPPQFQIKTNNPLNFPGLVDFATTLLKNSSTRTHKIASLQDKISVYSMFYLLIWFSVLWAGVPGKNNLPSLPDSLFVIFNVILFPSTLAFVFYTITHPGGLYINKFEHPILSFGRRITAGDFKDNLIISFVLWIIKLSVGGAITAVVGGIAWFFFGERLLGLLSSIF